MLEKLGNNHISRKTCVSQHARAHGLVIFTSVYIIQASQFPASSRFRDIKLSEIDNSPNKEFP